MLALDYVQPGEISADDWQWLRKADNAGPEYQMLPELQVEHWLKAQEMHLFRYNPGPGVVLVEVRRGANGRKRLAIVRTAGVSVVWTFSKVAELLQHTAKEWGCSEIETSVYSSVLARALERTGAVPESMNMVLEVK